MKSIYSNIAILAVLGVAIAATAGCTGNKEHPSTLAERDQFAHSHTDVNKIPANVGTRLPDGTVIIAGHVVGKITKK